MQKFVFYAHDLVASFILNRMNWTKKSFDRFLIDAVNCRFVQNTTIVAFSTRLMRNLFSGARKITPSTE